MLGAVAVSFTGQLLRIAAPFAILVPVLDRTVLAPPLVCRRGRRSSNSSSRRTNGGEGRRRLARDVDVSMLCGRVLHFNILHLACQRGYHFAKVPGSAEL